MSEVEHCYFTISISFENSLPVPSALVAKWSDLIGDMELDPKKKKEKKKI